MAGKVIFLLIERQTGTLIGVINKSLTVNNLRYFFSFYRQYKIYSMHLDTVTLTMVQGRWEIKDNSSSTIVSNFNRKLIEKIAEISREG